MFPEVPQACDNTLAIAERCNVELDLKTGTPRGIGPPDGSTPEDYLTRLCEDGAKKRYGEITDEVRERIDRELERHPVQGLLQLLPDRLGLRATTPARRASRWGPAAAACGDGGRLLPGPVRRGPAPVRAATSSGSWTRHRNEMPDIDIDICQDGRAGGHRLRPPEVRARRPDHHLRDAEGQGRRSATSAACWACRWTEADRLTKLMPEALKMTLDKALETEPELQAGCTSSNDADPQGHRHRPAARGAGPARRRPRGRRGRSPTSRWTNFVPLYKPAGSERRHHPVRRPDGREGAAC